MNVEVKVIQEFERNGATVKVGVKFVTDSDTGNQLEMERKVKILRSIPSHTPKHETTHVKKKRY